MALNIYFQLGVFFKMFWLSVSNLCDRRGINTINDFLDDVFLLLTFKMPVFKTGYKNPGPDPTPPIDPSPEASDSHFSFVWKFSLSFFLPLVL